MMVGRGHPGEDVQLYTRHRIVTLRGYGLSAAYIANYLGLHQFVVESVLREAEEGPEREW